jgi:succinate dehydrogenase/fumarate reductase flavoprotein subunit
MYNVTAKQLIREDNNTGRVSGVIAQRQSDGAYIKFVANKAVVMATGDFSTDRDMMAKYSPWVYNHFKDKFSWETNYDNQFVYTGLMPGDGQKMGLWIGAAWQRTYPNPCAINGGASGPAHAVISNFWGINLDINGRRFMNECTNFAYAGMAVLDLPEETAFAVWSQDYAYTEEEWDALGSVTDGGNGIPQSTPEDMIASWDENYTKADTLEELIDILYDGYSDEAKATALQSIANYTQYAKNGYDEEFQVNPEVLHPIENGPFYGTKTVGSTFLAVFGGLRTNDKCQVCEEDDTPIEGLYNVGTMIGDFYSNSYNFVLPGQNLGACCCTLPYLVGKRLGTEE